MSRRQVRQLHGPFHERLRAEREAVGLSQEKLAREVDVTLRTIQRWEDRGTERTEPKLSQVVTLARVLDCAVGDLWPIEPAERDAA